MDRAYLEIFFLCGMILQVILLFPYLQKYLKNGYSHLFNKKERNYLNCIGIGYLVLPLIYVFSTWFSWFDYNVPKLVSLLALGVYCFGFWVVFRAWSDLGSSWSVGTEIQKSHLLVTTGLYKWVRHPMYAAVVAIAAAQIFLLQNWLVGPAFIVVAIPFFLYRIKKEERELIIHFGDEYLKYKKQTNSVIPRTELIDFTNIPGRLKLLVTKKRKVKPS